MPRTFSVTNGHAEEVRECSHGGLHEWSPSKVGRELVFGHRRRCSKCLTEQIWRLKERPTPENAPRLGEWEDAPKWVEAYIQHWTDGTDPVTKEEG